MISLTAAKRNKKLSLVQFHGQTDQVRVKPSKLTFMPESINFDHSVCELIVLATMKL